MSTYSFITVSNRLPISVKKIDGTLEFEPSSGGLATAMSSLKAKNSVWVGWCGIATEELDESEYEIIRKEFLKHDAVPVFLSKSQVDLYYDGYANDTLWPLFHYFQSVAQYSDSYWDAYEQVNQLFSNTVAEIAEDNATIWVQDYHLMLTPEQIRHIKPHVTIGFFLHIPFPSFEIYRLLPERSAILRGLLGADLIGFHIYDYSLHFLDSVHRLLGATSKHGVISYEGRSVQTGTYPIGIDYKKFERTAESRAVAKQVRSLHSRYKKQKIILSIDRLDYSKGIPERLEAYRQLLNEHPEYIEAIKLVMVAVPSRTDVETYQKLRDRIEQTVSRINGTFGTADWAPISYQFQNRPFEEIVALYRSANVMLVTPIRDGMNLVAKEYVAAQKNDGGVLVLSEMAGAIDELPEALSVNPNSARSIARALHAALTMPKKERATALDSMKSRLKKTDIRHWGKTFVEDLGQLQQGNVHIAPKTFTQRDHARLREDFDYAAKKLLILDYDGTLKTHRSSPSMFASLPSVRLLRILRRLTLDPTVTVAIVSGRPRRALLLWLGSMNIELAAEHGAWTRYDNKWHRNKTNFKTEKKKLLPILKSYTQATKGAEIEKKDFSLVWHYRNVEPEIAYAKASKLRHDLSQVASDEIGIYEGDKIIEIKPKSITKGHVVKELIRKHHPDATICIGDDYTDEDMFRELTPSDYSFKVGDGDTSARFRLSSVEDTVRLLERLSNRTKL